MRPDACVENLRNRIRAHRVLETFVVDDGRDGHIEKNMSSFISECSLMSITRLAACGGERMRVEQRASERKSRQRGRPADVAGLVRAASDSQGS
jgi:hypothetical protein